MRWEADARSAVAMGALTLIGAAIPVSQAWVTKLIIDGVLDSVRRGLPPRESLMLVLPFILAELGLLLLSTILSKLKNDFNALVRFRLGHLVNLRIIRKALALEARYFEDSEFYDKMETTRRESEYRTKGIDLALRHTLDAQRDLPLDKAILEALAKAAAQDLGDFFACAIGATMLDLDAAPYGGARFPVEARLDDRTFVRFHLDVGAGDVVLTPLDVTQAHDWLEFAGIPGAKFPTITQEQQRLPRGHAPPKDALNAPLGTIVDELNRGIDNSDYACYADSTRCPPQGSSRSVPAELRQSVLMKACPVCALQFDDVALKCTTCGESLPVPAYLHAEAPIPERALTRWLLWLLIPVIAAIIAGYSWHKWSQSRISPQEVLRKCQASCAAQCTLRLDDPCTTPHSESFSACLSACGTTHESAPGAAF